MAAGFRVRREWSWFKYRKMPDTLVTMSGRYGDILWSLPTAKRIAEQVGHTVDFCCMPQYESLLPLLAVQRYIAKAFVLPNWICQGSPFGDQPWEAPVAELGYQRVFHLTYRYHPVNETLADFIARQQHIQLGDTWLPFLSVEDVVRSRGAVVAVGFNPDGQEQKLTLVNHLREHLVDVHFVDCSTLTWLQAAWAISQCKFFLGCRSSLAVVAHGFAKRCLIYEPNAARRPWIFGCRVGREVMPEMGNFNPFIKTAEEWLNA